MIRIAQQADAPAIAAVQVASWHAAYVGLIPDAVLDAFTVEARTARWAANLAETDPAPRTTVFERHGRVIAFASVGVSRDEDGHGEVWALYAHPDAWGTGAGRALIEDGIAYLVGRGLPRVMLRVLQGNARAIRFYEAAGFRVDGGHKVEEGLPHLRMQRDPARGA